MAQPTILTRSLSTLPFLALAVVCARAFQLNAPHVGPWLDEAVARGNIEWEGNSFQLFESFYGIRALDELWRVINVSFTPSTFRFDPVSSWQMFSFLADAGVVYAIWVLEASRKANIRTSAYYPSIFAQIFQVIGGGNIGPLYYIGYMLTVPRASSMTADTRRINLSHARTLLPTFLVVYYLPFLSAFFTQSLETRHSWTWFWQMFPIWIGVSQAILSRIFPASRIQPGATDDVTFSRLTILPIAAFSACTWLYTASAAPYSMRQIFIPESFVSTADPLAALRTLLHFDHLIFFTCPILWLAFLASDLQDAGMTRYGSVTWTLLLLTASLAIGPGAAVGLGWLAREGLLAEKFSQTKKKT